MSNEIVLTGTHGWLGSRMLHAVINGLPDYPDTQVANAQVRAFYRDGESIVPVEAAHGSSIENFSGDLVNAADCDKLFAGTEGATLLHTAGIIHPRRGTSTQY